LQSDNWRENDGPDRARGPGLAVIAGTGLSLARQGARRLGAFAVWLWRLFRPLLAGALQILLALIIVFEEWGWRPLADLLGRLARWRPWARCEVAIARLPPYAALLAFALPTLLLLPLKFVALFLIARGQLMLASALFIAAKVVATAMVARLFELTQPALMQIGWFAWAHDTVMPWKEALTERVRSSWPWRIGRVWKERLRRHLAVAWRRLSPQLSLAGAALLAGAARLRRRLGAAGGRLVKTIKRRLAAQL
jgi:hypothetical protein